MSNIKAAKHRRRRIYCRSIILYVKNIILSAASAGFRHSRLSRLQEIHHRLDRRRIASGAQARNHGGRGLRDVGLSVDLLAAVNIGYVELDDRPREHLERIQQRKRGESEGGGI